MIKMVRLFLGYIEAPLILSGRGFFLFTSRFRASRLLHGGGGHGARAIDIEMVGDFVFIEVADHTFAFDVSIFQHAVIRALGDRISQCSHPLARTLICEQ